MPRVGLVVAALVTAGFAGGFWLGVRSAQPLELAAPAEGTRRQLVQAPTAPSNLDHLVALGYVDGLDDVDIERSGVYVHDREKAWAGLNLYASSSEPTAWLIDMDGEVVHSWTGGDYAWSHVTLLPDGDVLAIAKDHALLRVDRAGDVEWVWTGRAHHDVDALPDGGFVTLARTSEHRPELHPSAPILVDRLVFLDGDGVPTGESVDLLALLQGTLLEGMLPAMAHLAEPSNGAALDPLHANAVEVFDGAVEGPLFARGNLLVSLRNINVIAILDGETHEPLWIWGPSNLTFQHHPTLLSDGTMLVFDNGLEASRVLQIDPETGQIVWSYEADDFFSATRGSNQRLPNGNTLITESDSGYVFEVTPEGERVWAWANPAGDGDRRNALQRMSRVAQPDWL